MKAIDITGKPPGGQRTPIAELVPLDVPLVVQIFPIYACTFMCKYCTMSIPRNRRGFISSQRAMPIDMFQKCIDDLALFNKQRIKVLRFVGMGEPLLHEHLPMMVEYAVCAKIFDKVEIITNGALLTQERSIALIEAGLTNLIISVQGTSAEKYYEISQIRLDFQDFLDKIQYFYDNSEGINVHIKIADCALDGPEDKQRFFDLFGDMCDTIGIENIGPIHKGVDFNDELHEVTENQYGAACADIDICTQPFYTMQINPDGNVVPCYSIEYPKIVGNVLHNSLNHIWSNSSFNKFRRQMLDGTRQACDVCKACTIFKHRAYKEDDLRSKVAELKEFYT